MNASASEPVVFLGSGAFGLPTLEWLAESGRLSLVVSQPDRPAGRGLKAQPTPVAAWAMERGVPLLRSANVCDGDDLERMRGDRARTFVIIAFGQKLQPVLLQDRFAVNLHGSLLPRWRGAAPIQRAVMEGDEEVGVTVISIAERMDAGVMYATARTRVGERETAGELHDRMALLGPGVIGAVLEEHASGTLHFAVQDETRATRARKLSRADAWVDLNGPARLVAARINGLAPWPGCNVLVDGEPLRVLRACALPSHSDGDENSGSEHHPVGTLSVNGRVMCGSGVVELLEVQPPGGRVMPFDAWQRGRRIESPVTMTSAPPVA